MPNHLRPRLTFANVVSCLALFVALGGSAYAVKQLPKNSVGTKQLKKNAVTKQKVRKNAITTAKITENAVTGAKVNEATFGTVPSAANAANAGHADTADTAGHADDADTVAGVSMKGFSYQTPASGGTVTLFSLNGLTLMATCSSGIVKAKTSVDHSYISAAWVTPTNVPEGTSDTDFNTTDSFGANTTIAPETGSIEYVQPDGKRVSVSLQADMSSACTLSGHAFASG